MAYVVDWLPPCPALNTIMVSVEKACSNDDAEHFDQQHRHV